MDFQQYYTIRQLDYSQKELDYLNLSIIDTPCSCKNCSGCEDISLYIPNLILLIGLISNGILRSRSNDSSFLSEAAFTP